MERSQTVGLQESAEIEPQLNEIDRQKVRGGYIGFVEELPGANTQGRTLSEARANLKEAIALVRAANQTLAAEAAARGKI